MRQCSNDQMLHGRVGIAQRVERRARNGEGCDGSSESTVAVRAEGPTCTSANSPKNPPADNTFRVARSRAGAETCTAKIPDSIKCRLSPGSPSWKTTRRG